MKKILITMMMVTVFASGISQINSNKPYNSNTNVKKELSLEEKMTFSDATAVGKYENYMKKRIINSVAVNRKVDLEGYNNEDRDKIANNFTDFALVTDDNYQMVYENEKGKEITRITYSEKDNIYVLSQISNEYGNILIEINNNKYLIEQDNDNIIMVNEYGEKINMIEVTERELYLERPTYYERYSEVIIDDENTILSRAVPVDKIKWSEYRLAEKTTNKTAVKFIRKVNDALGVVNYVVEHPVLGIITTTADIVTYVADTYYTTFYLLRYQSNADGCLSYVREKLEYYKKSNYTDLFQTKISYFWATRPENGGGRCAEYYYGS